MVNLSVNLNKVALLRNQRDIAIPSVTQAALSVIAAGANGITIHPRPDERHIRKSDVYEIQKLWDDGRIHKNIEYNIEGYPSPEWLQLVKDIRPTQATLVPDAPQARTSDNGWDAIAHSQFLKPIIADLQKLNIRVSLFINPEPQQIIAAQKINCNRIELYTAPYAEAFNNHKEKAIAPYIEAAEAANRIGLGINAGHDLNLNNLNYFAGNIKNLMEVSIGHALTADALWLGWDKTIKQYLNALRQ